MGGPTKKRSVPEESDDQYEVESILNKRQRKGRGGPVAEYLIKWLGYGAEQATWEPTNNIHAELVAAFEASGGSGGAVQPVHGAGNASSHDAKPPLPPERRRKKTAMSLVEVEALASAEGLKLVPGFEHAAANKEHQSGYWRVQAQKHHLSFKACGEDGRAIGNFPSAAEGALAVARQLGAAKSHEMAAKATATLATLDAPPMALDEARRLAAAEGLQLVPSASNWTGWLNVTCNRSLLRAEPSRSGSVSSGSVSSGSGMVARERVRPFQVTLSKCTTKDPCLKCTRSLGVKDPSLKCTRSLGVYTSAAEAALVYARHLGPAM